jgi:NhaP-type Na+/H+ or K+/H+ antiporter
MEKQVILWEEANFTSEQIEASKSMMETFSNPAITAAMGISGGAFFGFIISAIAGAIMKRTEEDQY